jgi:DNA replication and repair protein RecF
MHVKHLSLANFRNHASAEISLQPGLNLFIGENGNGKTNIVEAVGYLSTLNSHRVVGYEPLISRDQNSAVIRTLAHNEGRDVLVELELHKGAPNRARINKANVSRLRDVIGTVPSVTFAPEDIELVKGQPADRRKFIDELLMQLSPRFAGVIGDYERVLKQRNTLLRTAKQTGAKGSALATLDAWDEQLVKYGSELSAARVDLAGRLTPQLRLAYRAIADQEQAIAISIKSTLVSALSFDENSEDLVELTEADARAIEATFRERLAEIRPKELERGITLIGPHRDDLVLLLNDMPAKSHASSGEIWSFAIALRLASLALIREASRIGDPILILDDVFATLDAGRRERLARLVESNEQVLITAAVPEDVPSSLNAKVYQVRKGGDLDG